MQAINRAGFGRRGYSRLARNRLALTGLCVIAAIVAMALVGPIFSEYDYEEVDWEHISTGPSVETGHWFGTDSLGRDLYVRTLYGVRISLLVGVCATGVSFLIGVTYGAIAGYTGGRVDQVMMRFVDIMYALPFMFLVIVLALVFGRSLWLIFIAIGAIEWLNMSRIIRGQTLTLKNVEFVEAARAYDAPTRRIIGKHIIPNVMSSAIAYATLTIPQAILAESYLSFLGFGVQEPMTSLGALIAEGSADMETAPWMLIFPGLFLAASLYGFNFLGDGLRDASDPRDY